MLDLYPLVTTSVGVGIVLITTASAVFQVAPHNRKGKGKKNALPKVYEDKDGISTEELTNTFSTFIPKTIICIFTLLGLATSTALAVLSTLGLSKDGFFIENWINLGAWILLSVQAILLVVSKDSVQSYNLGTHGMVSCVAFLGVIFLQDNLLLERTSGSVGPTAPFVLRIIQFVLTIGAGISHISIPRRPNVFDPKGRPIDRSMTTSILSRYTFTWSEPELKLAHKKGTLDLTDLPRLDHDVRSKEITDKWVAAKMTNKLWIQVFLAHKEAFILQYFLTLLQSVGNVMPQFMLFKILKVLEERDGGRAKASDAWIWVIGLGLSTIVASWIEAWLFWISQSEVSIPIRSELSNLIFRKSMRRKDVRGATGKKKEKVTADPLEAPNVAVQASAGPAPDNEQQKDDKEEDVADEGVKSTTNMVGVDAKRICDFASFNNYIPGSIFKLIAAFTLLIGIIGWKALSAGMISMVLITPINIYYSKKYNAAQTRLMETRDVKEAAVQEALKGVRQIKFSALEKGWSAKIMKIRQKELLEVWNVFKADTALLGCWIASPIILSATSLAVYSISADLTPSIAFASIGVFNSLQVTLSIIPELTTDLIDAIVSIKRIEEYLNAPEISDDTTVDAENVYFDNATFAFPSDDPLEEHDERFMLRNITVSFPKNELSIISGATGSGKSLMLNAILGEVDVFSGSIGVPRAPNAHDRHDAKATKENWYIPQSLAYVSQVPWIENASIKDNILFGLPYDHERYQKTIDNCALTKDLEMLTDGESTEIGANGINLSGGQKWRLSFARALYSRAGILILDDIFSAVDAHVGRHIFEKGLAGELGVGRTRILVTHHVALCKPRTKYIVELDEGTVKNAGLLSELEEDGTLREIMSHEETAASKGAREDEDNTAVNSEDSSDIDDVGEPLKKVDTKASVKKFVEEEAKEKGGVKKRLYVDYLKSSGGLAFWTFGGLLFIGFQVLSIGRSWWLRLWTESNQESMASNFMVMTTQFPMKTIQQEPSLDFHTSEANERLWYYLGIYIAIAFGSAFISTFTFFYVFYGSLQASRDLFTRMLFTVLRAPLRWHDTVPIGRIVNRFTADFNIVDSRLSLDIIFFFRAFLSLLGVSVAGVIVSPYVVILAVAMAGTCVYITRLYLTAARETKRLESIAKSPVFSQFASTLTGIATIRAFDKPETYVTSFEELIDSHCSTLWYLWLFNRWLGWRMNIIGAVFAIIVGGLVISVTGLDASISGFALFFALEATGSITWSVRHYANLELDMNAAERVVEYIGLPTEDLGGIEPPAAWPTEGRMEVSNLTVSYAPDLPAVLNDLSFKVERNERIGVVGRTGAGKSSLTLALFRFLEAKAGTIYVDGIDISKITLEALRSRLAIIPQDPVLFSGTVRSNLDPFDEHSDVELMDALKRVHLVSPDSANVSGTQTPLTRPGTATATVGTSVTATDGDTNKNIFRSLSSPISPSGLNLSQGQRQLLCLARAIVSMPKIMVLDEATSSVDVNTDEKIQRSIREEFANSTLLVIAHRLSTIADFDKIMVLDQGKIVEFAPPKELMSIPNGVFRGMVGTTGEGRELEKIIMGEDYKE